MLYIHGASLYMVPGALLLCLRPCCQDLELNAPYSLGLTAIMTYVCLALLGML